jgi:hypothetical protein
MLQLANKKLDFPLHPHGTFTTRETGSNCIRHSNPRCARRETAPARSRMLQLADKKLNFPLHPLNFPLHPLNFPLHPTGLARCV